MKKKILTILFAIMLFFSIDSVNAACTNEEKAKLNSEASKIRVSYAEKIRICNAQDNWCNEDVDNGEAYDPDGTITNVEEEDYSEEIESFDITMLNITENLYIVVKNNVGFGPRRFNYVDSKDGVITFNYEEIMEIANFTFEVYASEKTSCPNEKLRAIPLTTPRLNLYSFYSICEEYPDHDMCKKYVMFPEDEEYSPGDFSQSMDKYIESQKETSDKDDDDKDNPKQTIKELIEENKIILFGVGATVIIIITVIVVTRVKGNKKNETKW